MVRGQINDHPALKHELAAPAFVCRDLQRMGLNCEPLRPSLDVRREAATMLRRGWAGQTTQFVNSDGYRPHAVEHLWVPRS